VTERVVVSGVGMVTPLGIGAEATWRAVLAGANGIGPITRFDATGFPVRFAGEAPVAGEGAELKARLTDLAAREALEMSGLSGGERVGVCVGSEACRPPWSWLWRTDVPTAAEVQALAPDAPTRQVAALAGALGPRSTVSTACTSSSQALGEALQRIRRGEVDAMVCGGVDALSEPLMVVGFSKLGALSTRNEAPEAASRPFDLHRDGFVLGEGAGFLVLERESVARARGAPILAVLEGYGCSCNAWRITDSPPDGRGAYDAMRLALADAGLGPGDIDYVNAHGTSTQQNDASESTALSRLLAGVPTSSTKGMMGHLVAASGAVEAILCVLALRDGVMPGSRNLEQPDPGCGVQLVRDATPAPLRHVLTNAFGFGGSNGSLIFGCP
jgi:3-oxoacyl-[acyl-carrier-protein] synthase II